MRRGGRGIVVGGGLAGMAAARELGDACTLIEAEDRLGGLVRTEVIEGFSFDWTGHWLHARDPEMRNAAEFILRDLGEGFARHFMFPYNEKLYTVRCEELSSEWGGRFIPRPSLQNV